MAAKASETIVTVPAARPSRPSVRFTALLMPATMMNDQNQVEPRHHDRHARNGNDCREHTEVEPVRRSAAPAPTSTARPSSRRAARRSPRRHPARTASRGVAGQASARATTFDQSSMKPSRPQPSIAPSASRLSRDVRPSTRNVAVTTSRISTPPIVGVPCLTKMTLRPVGPDLLTDVAHAQQADPQRKEQRRRDHRDDDRKEHLIGRILGEAGSRRAHDLFDD